ncbi:MAG: glycosyltransferase, partial [Chloroflexi bacterium]|nr:glycosyltransferase [Chloroflexota bacterium]
MLLPAARNLLRASTEFRPHVIQGHTFNGFPYGLACAWALRRPFVYMVPATFAQIGDAGFGWVLTWYRLFHGQVDWFFSAYPSELRRLGVPETKITHVAGAVDVPEVEAVRVGAAAHRRSVRQALGIELEAPMLLSVGRLHSSKGHHLAINALAALLATVPDAHLVILGEGHERA